MEHYSWLRKSKVYVRNLEDEVDDERLRKEFSQFGPIIDAKVIRDESGRSRGFGFVWFASLEAAREAIAFMNDRIIVSKPLYVDLVKCKIDRAAHYLASMQLNETARMVPRTQHMCIPREDETNEGLNQGFLSISREETNEGLDQGCMSIPREETNEGLDQGRMSIPREMNKRLNQCYTKVYVQNFGLDFDNARLRSSFEGFGEITSAAVARDETGMCRGFGFVDFEFHDAAAKAVEEMNGRLVNGRRIRCSRALTQVERERERIRKYKTEMMQHCRSLGREVCIRNLENEVDVELLRQEFSKFGTITSVRLIRMKYDWRRDVGFVCFTSSEAARKAVISMHGCTIMSKPLSVSMATITLYGVGKRE